MSESLYRNHAIRAQIETLVELSESPLFSSEDIIANEAYVFARDKIFATVKIIHSFLEQTPAILASIHGLNQLNSQLQNITNGLNAFLQDSNPNRLLDAVNIIDQSVLPSMWSFLPRLHEIPKSSVSSIVADLRTSANEALQNIVKQRTDLSISLDQVRGDITIESGRLSDLGELLVDQKNETLAINGRLQQEFFEKEIERSTTFSEDRKKTNEAASNLLIALAKSRDNANQILQVIGNIGTTGNFRLIATREGKQADIWRNITIGLFGVGVCVALVTFYRFLDAPPTIEHAWSAGIRLLYAIAITSPAWYAGKESARHRTNSDRARQTELELASLGPFIELMPEEKKCDS